MKNFVRSCMVELQLGRDQRFTYEKRPGSIVSSIVASFILQPATLQESHRLSHCTSILLVYDSQLQWPRLTEMDIVCRIVLKLLHQPR